MYLKQAPPTQKMFIVLTKKVMKYLRLITRLKTSILAVFDTLVVFMVETSF